MRAIFLISSVIVVASVALLGCSRKIVVADGGPDIVIARGGGPDVVVVGKQGQGPPDHAPAHGYRKKHPGKKVALVYDSKLQVYVVSNHNGCYYSAGQYFRVGVSTWEWSVDIEGPWHTVKSLSDVPRGLRKMDVSAKQKKKAKDKEKGKGKAR